jgi:hypothetical protein
MKLLFAGIAAIFLPVHISARAEDAPGAPARKPSSSGARGDMTAQRLVDRDWPAGWPHR